MGLISASWQIFFRWNVNWNTIIYIDAGNGRYTRVEIESIFSCNKVAQINKVQIYNEFLRRCVVMTSPNANINAGNDRLYNWGNQGKTGYTQPGGTHKHILRFIMCFCHDYCYDISTANGHEIYKKARFIHQSNKKSKPTFCDRITLDSWCQGTWHVWETG